MNSPFPGMDPHLEHPHRWQGVHNALIVYLTQELAPILAPNYYVATESSTYIVTPSGYQSAGKPDLSVISPIGVLPSSGQTSTGSNLLQVELAMPEEITHYYLEVREVGSHTVVTTIEVLSPANKSDKNGRKSYLKKRDKLLQSATNLVEIDLLRTGKPLPLAHAVPKSDYRILVSRWWNRPTAELHTFTVRTPIPNFSLPLTPDEDEPVVDLNEIVHRLYRQTRFDLRVDYSLQPVPKLSDEDWAWAQSLINA